MKSYSKINTNFHENEMLKEGCCCVSLNINRLLSSGWVKAIICKNF